MTSLFTCGYEGLDIAALIERLKSVGVQLVVDVRELPVSRKSGFSKRALNDALAQADIGYRHVPTLGCPKAIREHYKASADWDTYTRDFLAYIETQDEAVQGLAELAQSSCVCLLCFEADHAKCHRTFVARAAHAKGAPPVAHLTAHRSARAEMGRRAAAASRDATADSVAGALAEVADIADVASATAPNTAPAKPRQRPAKAAVS